MRWIRGGYNLSRDGHNAMADLTKNIFSRKFFKAIFVSGMGFRPIIQVCMFLQAYSFVVSRISPVSHASWCRSWAKSFFWPPEIMVWLKNEKHVFLRMAYDTTCLLLAVIVEHRRQNHRITTLGGRIFYAPL